MFTSFKKFDQTVVKKKSLVAFLNNRLDQS